MFPLPSQALALPVTGFEMAIMWEGNTVPCPIGGRHWFLPNFVLTKNWFSQKTLLRAAFQNPGEDSSTV